MQTEQIWSTSVSGKDFYNSCQISTNLMKSKTWGGQWFEKIHWFQLQHYATKNKQCPITVLQRYHRQCPEILSHITGSDISFSFWKMTKLKTIKHQETICKKSSLDLCHFPEFSRTTRMLKSEWKKKYRRVWMRLSDREYRLHVSYWLLIHCTLWNASVNTDIFASKSSN